jgi:hypothetical protein
MKTGLKQLLHLQEVKVGMTQVLHIQEIKASSEERNLPAIFKLSKFQI